MDKNTRRTSKNEKEPYLLKKRLRRDFDKELELKWEEFEEVGKEYLRVKVELETILEDYNKAVKELTTPF